MGEVRYNGHYRYEFNMARTLAMVDQLDDHVANLTVRETLEFARRCQVCKLDNGWSLKCYGLMVEVSTLLHTGLTLQSGK